MKGREGEGKMGAWRESIKNSPAPPDVTVKVRDRVWLILGTAPGRKGEVGS